MTIQVVHSIELSQEELLLVWGLKSKHQVLKILIPLDSVLKLVDTFKFLFCYDTILNLETLKFCDQRDKLTKLSKVTQAKIRIVDPQFPELRVILLTINHHFEHLLPICRLNKSALILKAYINASDLFLFLKNICIHELEHYVLIPIVYECLKLSAIHVLIKFMQIFEFLCVPILSWWCH